jgi:DNA-binding Xre family transcriptional regulator
MRQFVCNRVLLLPGRNSTRSGQLYYAVIHALPQFILRIRIYIAKMDISSNGVIRMTVSYKKLWILLIERDIRKKDLQEAVGLSTTTMSKLNRNKTVSMEVLMKICAVLDTRIEEILEFVP